MPYFDLPIESLEVYLPPRKEAPDFDAFWDETLTEVRSYPLNPEIEPVDYGLKTVHTFDITFAGYGGQPVKGWLLLPKEQRERLPCIVEFIGYGGGRGFPIDWLLWSSAGYAHLIMDTRGQGSTWRKGDTPDVEPPGSCPHHPGFMTRGILSPHTYYYRRLISDAVRAVDVAWEHPAVDPDRIAVTGRSQGGGLALAAAGLDRRISMALPDVPFLCAYRRAVEITDEKPYGEISRYCEVHRDKIDTVFQTLSYFDGVNFAVRAAARALFSVGLMDEVCPPSTVFAAYNYYAGPKDKRVYPFNHHEGGDNYHELEKIRFLSAYWN